MCHWFLLFIIWKNSKARIRVSLLQMPYNKGGLKFPNIFWYCWATKLRSIKFFIDTSNALQDLYRPNSNTLISFEEITCQYNIDKTYFLLIIILLRYFIWTNNNTLTKPKKQTWKEYLKIVGAKVLYQNCIISYHLTQLKTSDSKLRAWNEDLATNISKEDWESACTNSHKQLINDRFRLLQYKCVRIR